MNEQWKQFNSHYDISNHGRIKRTKEGSKTWPGRNRLIASSMNQREIGELYGVSQQAISDIKNGKRWIWVEEE